MRGCGVLAALAALPLLRLLLLLLVVVVVVGPAQAGCPFHTTPKVSSGGAGAGDDDAASGEWEAQIPMAMDQSDPLVRVNDLFHSNYDETKARMLPSAYVVQEVDYLVLFLPSGEEKGGADGQDDTWTRIAEPMVPPLYHNLKMVSHLPVTTFSILTGNTTGTPKLDEDTIGRLRQYLHAVQQVTLTPDRFDGNLTVLMRNERIQHATEMFLEEAIATGMVSDDQLRGFVKDIVDPVVDNVNEAAAAQVNMIDSIMARWRENLLTEEQWEEINIAVTVSHMASDRSLAAQYFERLFDADQWWNENFFTLEAVSDEDTARNVMTTHPLDYAIGDVFFDDEYRMHIDLLADGATLALDDLFGPASESSSESASASAE